MSFHFGPEPEPKAHSHIFKKVEKHNGYLLILLIKFISLGPSPKVLVHTGTLSCLKKWALFTPFHGVEGVSHWSNEFVFLL